MKDALIISLLSVLPRRTTSRLIGGAMRMPLPGPLNRALLRWYVRKYGPNLEECEGTLLDYPCLASFFVRALRPGTRPIDTSAEALVSPVDAQVYAVGQIVGGRLPQSPDLDYAVSTLLGGDERWDGGGFAVLYLSPKDYHRVHSPREGVIRGWRYRPGNLWPVFPAATRRIRDLFAGNERLVIRLGTDLGEIAVVMVGAFGVGRMSTTFCDLVTNGHRASLDDHPSSERPVTRGAELGRFEMGSTVIVITEPGRLAWEIQSGDRVRVGQRIGRKT